MQGRCPFPSMMPARCFLCLRRLPLRTSSSTQRSVFHWPRPLTWESPCPITARRTGPGSLPTSLGTTIGTACCGAMISTSSATRLFPESQQTRWSMMLLSCVLLITSVLCDLAQQAHHRLLLLHTLRRFFSLRPLRLLTPLSLWLLLASLPPLMVLKMRCLLCQILTPQSLKLTLVPRWTHLQSPPPQLLGSPLAVWVTGAVPCAQLDELHRPAAAIAMVLPTTALGLVADTRDAAAAQCAGTEVSSGGTGAMYVCRSIATSMGASFAFVAATSAWGCFGGETIIMIEGPPGRPAANDRLASIGPACGGCSMARPKCTRALWFSRYTLFWRA